MKAEISKDLENEFNKAIAYRDSGRSREFKSNVILICNV
jgi:hypothetical protein